MFYTLINDYTKSCILKNDHCFAFAFWKCGRHNNKEMLKV